MKTKTLITAKGQRLEITYESGVKVLNTERANYSFGSLHKVFDKAFESTGISRFKASGILMLGLGAGSVVKLLRRKYMLDAPITAVEFDEDIIKIANTEFGLSQYSGVTCICDDAFSYMAGQTDTYDLIIDDIYLDTLMPGQSLQEQYIETVKRALNPGGLFLKNCMFSKPAQAAAFEVLLKKKFSEIKTIKAGKANTVYACYL